MDSFSHTHTPPIVCCFTTKNPINRHGRQLVSQTLSGQPVAARQRCYNNNDNTYYYHCKSSSKRFWRWLKSHHKLFGLHMNYQEKLYTSTFYNCRLILSNHLSYLILFMNKFRNMSASDINTTIIISISH